MTITTYYATYNLGRRDAEADAIVHFVNDTTAGSGDSRSWDATHAYIDTVADADTQQRLGIVIAADQFELVDAED